jgi:hypothetical protein
MDIRARFDLLSRRLGHIQFSLTAWSLGEPAPSPPPGFEVRPIGLGGDLSFLERAIDGDLTPRVETVEEAIDVVEDRYELELTDDELDHLADVGADAADRGLFDDELLAVVTAAADQMLAARGR